ncbi:MAG TPA: (deoxy)nucleoside triphosphate pyrophosphohydrolase [Mycobacteriales bacterium]|nr:(deoxy)nucleoside triphosphate pyrophosphohydrolase [Mycobacteriales bacterium]
MVGAAILDSSGRLLAAERTKPAGMWEFPGGKVEEGETDVAALVRECAEELGVEVEPGERLGPDVPLPGGGGGVLRVWRARIVRGTPQALEHRSLRWLAARELGDVPWLPADVPLVELLRQELR